MIIFGVLLMIIGFVMGIPLVGAIGVIVFGLVLWLLGVLGHVV